MTLLQHKYVYLKFFFPGHMIITSLAREGKDIAEDFKKSLKTKVDNLLTKIILDSTEINHFKNDFD